LSLSGTFDLFVTQSELGLIIPVLDALVASGILTKHQRFIESDSLIANTTSPVVDAVVSVAASPSLVQVIPLPIPDAAGDNTYTFITAKKIEIVDAVVIPTGGGAGNTIKIQDGTPADITNAFSAATDKAVVHAGTIDRTKSVIAAGGTVNVLAHRAAGTMLCVVFLYVVLR
jgi:hypothetical protein